MFSLSWVMDMGEPLPPLLSGEPKLRWDINPAPPPAPGSGEKAALENTAAAEAAGGRSGEEAALSPLLFDRGSGPLRTILLE